MKSRLKVLFMAIGIMITASLCFGYVNNLKVWVNNEVLTHTDLNGNFTKVNTALDEVQGGIADTSTVLRSLFLLKSAVKDSVDSILANDTTVTKNADVRDSSLAAANTIVGDSTAVRQQSSFNLDYMLATADSIAANDSLDIEITHQNPLGNKQAAFFHNKAGVSETIKLTWTFKLPNIYATLDSIVFPCWTETKAGIVNFGIVQVYEDSLETEHKGTVKATGDTLYSDVTARVKANKKVAPNYVPGANEIVLRMTVTTTADSMFVGRPRVYVTNR